MKKLMCSLVIFFSISQCMDYRGNKLKYDTIKLINKASIPFEISWIEVLPGKEGRQKVITRTIKAGETTLIKLGEVGAYFTGTPAKVVYKPIPNNEEFNQEFIIDLSSSKEFAFTAVKLAEILNNIWVPGVLKADEKGNFSSFQYMNMQHPSQWEEAMKNAGKVKTIK